MKNIHLEAVTRLLPLLKRCADKEQVIDMQDVLERYAFDNVCKVAFNVDPGCLADDDASRESDVKLLSFTGAFRDTAELTAARFCYSVPGFWKIKKLFGVGSECRLRESIVIVHGFASQVIRSQTEEQQSSEKPQSDDLLSRFIAIGEYPVDVLQDIVISFILAGRETTSSALTWFF